MLERLKRALVESYVGAVALGYLLAQIVLEFVGIFASPMAQWVSRINLREMMPSTTAPAGFQFFDALPYLIRFVVLVPVWWLLVRWLYYNSPRPKDQAVEPAP